VTRSLIICHEARRLEARRLARAGVSGVVSANENRRRSSSDSFLVLDVQHLVQHADCSRVSQLDVVGAGGVSGALIDAEKEVAKQVLLLVLLVLLVSVPCVCMCVRCLLAYGCRTIRSCVYACILLLKQTSVRCLLAYGCRTIRSCVYACILLLKQTSVRCLLAYGCRTIRSCVYACILLLKQTSVRCLLAYGCRTIRSCVYACILLLKQTSVRCLLAYGCRTIRDTRTYAHALKQYAGCCRLDGTRADATREGLSFQNHHRGLLGGARSGHGETAAVVVCLFL
jgi:hypothetical protein